MNTTATFSSDNSWSRRCSTESVLSIQGKETDIARDTSDTDGALTDATDASDVEYEPVTDIDEDGPLDEDDTSANSDNDIIATKVIEVSVGDDGELQFADSERERTDARDSDSDSEMDLHDYWNCAQCHAKNNNPLYRYCHKCFQVRKNFFPPRPRRKRNLLKTDEIPRTLSQDSGVDSPMSQETDSPATQETDVLASQETDMLATQETDVLATQETDGPATQETDVLDSQETDMLATQETDVLATQETNGPATQETDVLDSQETDVPASQDVFPASQDVFPPSQEGADLGEGTSNPIPSSISSYRKRRAESADRRTKRKRARTDSDTELDSDDDLFDSKPKIDVRPLVKTVSDPAITIEDKPPKITKKVIANSLIEKMEEKDLCMICISEPKSGVFVHGRIAHICCCYKCAVKVWAKAKRCPVCNCKVSNVLKAVVM